MRKVIVFIATSLDGYIARRDGDVSWLFQEGDYGMASFYRSIDTVLMGRKTWETGVALGQSHYPGKTNYVFSRARRKSTKDVEFISADVAAFVRRLRRTKGKDIWLVGGGEIIEALLQAQQIDEFILYVHPILLGDGIPLMTQREPSIPLKLVSVSSYEDGLVRMHYQVAKRRLPSKSRKKK